MIGVYIVPELCSQKTTSNSGVIFSVIGEYLSSGDSRLDTKRNFARFIGTADQAEGVLWVTWEARVRHCRLVSNESKK